MKRPLRLAALFLALGVTLTAQGALPAGPLVLRDFTLRFDPAGTFALSGSGWPAMNGTWRTSGNEMTLQMAEGPAGCTGPGRYTFAVTGGAVTLSVVADDCTPRRMILDRNLWMPPGTAAPKIERRITRTAVSAPRLPSPATAAGSWPYVRAMSTLFAIGKR